MKSSHAEASDEDALNCKIGEVCFKLANELEECLSHTQVLIDEAAS